MQILLDFSTVFILLDLTAKKSKNGHLFYKDYLNVTSTSIVSKFCFLNWVWSVGKK